VSVIGNTSTASSAVKFANLGDSVGGRIVAFEEYQEKEFGDNPAAGIKKGDLKFYPKSGDPVMGVLVTLERNPGDVSSRVSLYAQGARMLKAIAAVVKAEGASDLEIGADLAVTFTGYDGRAKVYQAAYGRPEAAEAVAA
jgi:hypothetical protein